MENNIKRKYLTIIERRVSHGALLFGFLLLSLFGNASLVLGGDPLGNDSTIVIQDSSRFHKNFARKWNMEHSPMKATIYSAVLPSWGQLYNKKYWKMPIVYAGIGTCLYFIVTNNREFLFYRSSYVAYYDSNPSTIPQFDPTVYNVEENMEYYHRMRDISYMALAGVYILQLIDANVDAHLWYYDVSPNLGLHIHPSLINTGQPRACLGISLHF